MDTLKPLTDVSKPPSQGIGSAAVLDDDKKAQFLAASTAENGAAD